MILCCQSSTSLDVAVPERKSLEVVEEDPNLANHSEPEPVKEEIRPRQTPFIRSNKQNEKKLHLEFNSPQVNDTFQGRV